MTNCGRLRRVCLVPPYSSETAGDTRIDVRVEGRIGVQARGGTHDVAGAPSPALTRAVVLGGARSVLAGTAGLQPTVPRGGLASPYIIRGRGRGAVARRAARNGRGYGLQMFAWKGARKGYTYARGRCRGTPCGRPGPRNVDYLQTLGPDGAQPAFCPSDPLGLRPGKPARAVGCLAVAAVADSV